MLPFLPLDGGHFCNQVLFSRNRYLEASFSVFGIVGLVALAVFLKSWAIGVLAFLMVAGVVRSIRIRSIAHELTAKHGVAVLDREREPSDALLFEIDEAVEKRLQITSVPQRAVVIDQVLEVARHQPPRVLASVALLFVYLAPIPLAGISVIATALVTPLEQPSSAQPTDPPAPNG